MTKPLFLFITLLFAFKANGQTLNTPSLISPSNTATLQPANALLDWSAVTNATNYDVHYGTDPTFGVFSSFNVTSSQANCANLTFGATYYWRVKARSATDSSNWSVTWSFVVQDTIFLISPANNSLNLSSNELLDWSAVGGITGYQVQWDTSASFSSSLSQTFSTGTSSQINTGNLLFGTRWYWRVRAFHSADTTQWSPVWNFTVADTIFLISPANNATGLSSNETLDWAAVSGITGYQVQWDTSASFSSPLFQTFSLGASSQTATGNLLFGTRWYWRVRAFHATDTTQWSPVWNFTVADTIFLISPANNATGMTSNETLDWAAVSGITGYQVQWDTSASFSSSLFQSFNIGATSQIPTGNLLFGTRWYWRVRAFHATDTTQWSPVWNFTVADTIFLISPANNAVGMASNETLDWAAVSGITGYQVQWDTSASFSSSLFQTFNLGATSQTATVNLLFGTRWYWRVRAFHATDTTQWSPVWSFTTADTLFLISPANNATLQDPNVLLDWAAVSGITGYQVQLDTSISFGSTALITSGLGATSQYTTGNLFFGTVYHWRVRAIHANDTTQWSAVWNFRTIDSLFLISPGNNSISQPLNLTLDWAALNGINGYELQVSSDSLFVNPSSYIATTSQQAVMNLSYGTRYFWRVRAFHTADTTSWGAVWRFETLFQITAIPTLSFPLNGTINAPLSDTLRWLTVNDPSITSYEIQLDDNNLFSSPQVITRTDTLSPYTGLNWNTTYYWRVRCKNGSGNGPWSTIWNFTTPLNVGLNEISNTNVIAYPNPAIAGQPVQIVLPGVSIATVEIFHIDGRLLKTLPFNREGRAEIEFQDPGLYLLRTLDAYRRPTGVTKMIIR